jgi:hypothetical protein
MQVRLFKRFFLFFFLRGYPLCDVCCYKTYVVQNEINTYINAFADIETASFDVNDSSDQNVARVVNISCRRHQILFKGPKTMASIEENSFAVADRQGCQIIQSEIFRNFFNYYMFNKKGILFHTYLFSEWIIELFI